MREAGNAGKRRRRVRQVAGRRGRRRRVLLLRRDVGAARPVEVDVEPPAVSAVPDAGFLCLLGVGVADSK